jgi:hypothetical protein
MPNALMYPLAVVDPRLSLSFVRRRLGPARRLDNRKSIEGLGVRYRPVRDTILDTAESFAALRGD